MGKRNDDNDNASATENGRQTPKLGVSSHDGQHDGIARQRKRRRVVAIVAVIAVALAVGGVGMRMLQATSDSGKSASRQTSQAVNGNGDGSEGDGSAVGSSSKTSTTTTNVDGGQNASDDGTHGNGDSGDSSESYPDADNGGPRKSGISDVTMARQQKEDAYLKTIDTNAIGGTASAFMRAFLTFDSASLASGSWRSGCLAYVDYGQMSDDANEDGLMYRRLRDDTWAQYAAKYPTFYGQVQGVTVNSVYATTSDDGTISPVADVSVICDACDGEPGTSPWWDRVTRKNVNYLVHFDTSGKVVSVGNVGSTTLQEIRSSRWHEDTTGAQ